MTAKKCDFPIVMVEWNDSAQPTTHWEWADEINEPEPIFCRTVGFLIKKTREGVSIALSLGDTQSERLQVNGIMQIPRSAIRQITSLAPYEGARAASQKQRESSLASE